MKQIVVKMSCAMVTLAVGLAMIQSGVERMQLASEEANRQGTEAVIPGGVYLLLIAGVFVLNLAAFAGLTIWSRHLRERPETWQAPPWVLLAAMVATGGLGLAGYSSHFGSLAVADTVPTTVDWGFVALETILGTVFVGALILLGARWTPRHKPARARY